MTATTGAPFNLVYQTLSDPADISDAIHDLAVSVDTAVQALYNAAALGAARPAGKLASAVVQSIPNNVSTNLTWPAGSEYYDNDGMVDNTATTDRITFQHTGIFMVSVRCSFASVAGAGFRQISVTSSGAPGLVARKAQLGVSGSDAVVHIVTVLPVNAVGEFVQFAALQTSGVAENAATRQVQAFRLYAF
jgi:hypothetical protein